MESVKKLVHRIGRPPILVDMPEDEIEKLYEGTTAVKAETKIEALERRVAELEKVSKWQ